MSDVEALEVSLDVSAIPERLTGAGHYVVELVRSLAALNDAVHLTLWARRGDRRRWLLAAPGHEVVSVAPRTRPARLCFEQLGLPIGLAWSRPRPLEVHHGPHYTMPVLARIPKVVTIHDLTLVEHPEWHLRSKAAVFSRAIGLAAERAAVLICVSDVTAMALRERFEPRGAVVVARHGVDPDRFSPFERELGRDAAVLERRGIAGEYLLYLGTLEPRKGIVPLLAAFDELAAGRSELRLVLAGRPGWGVGQLERALAALRHRDRVLRLGYVPDQEVPSLLRRAAAVVYPSEEEGFGMPALEALACGVTLVTTEGSAMEEVAGPAAWLSPPGVAGPLAEVIGAALDDGAEASRRRAVGLAIAARSTWTASAEAHLGAYRLAVG